MSTHDYRDTWERYARSWKVASADEKRALFDSCLSPHCVYRDPLTEAGGYDALLDYMLAFHVQIPGGHFVTKEFFFHHGRSLARWDMVGGSGEILGEGASYGEYGEDGKLVTMTGFFETPGGEQSR